MARTINIIFDEITDWFIKQTAIKAAYNLDETKTFDAQFNKVSIESFIFYAVAFGIWVLEKLFDILVIETDLKIANQKALTPLWYRNKMLEYQHGRNLIPDTDQYDNNDVSDETIDAERLVKYCAVVEQLGKIYIKIAGGESGNRNPVPDEVRNGVDAYIKEIKAAGVQYVIVNNPPDHLRVLSLDIYYNPMVLTAKGTSIKTGKQPVEEAIQNYIENLDFNGEFRTCDLVDILQNIDGVIIPELKSLESSPDPINIPYKAIDAKITPESGYLRVYDLQNDLLNGIKYIAYV